VPLLCARATKVLEELLCMPSSSAIPLRQHCMGKSIASHLLLSSLAGEAGDHWGVRTQGAKPYVPQGTPNAIKMCFAAPSSVKRLSESQVCCSVSSLCRTIGDPSAKVPIVKSKKSEGASRCKNCSSSVATNRISMSPAIEPRTLRK
jgi:hypothetical protein